MSSEQTEKFCILTCYYRPKPGGFCKRLFRGIRGLVEAGHTVHYLAVVPFPIEHPNCHFHHFPWPENRTSGYLFWACFHVLAPLILFYLGFRYKIQRLFAFGYTYSLFLQPLRLVKRIPLTVFFRADTVKNHQIKGRSKFLIQLEHLFEGLGIIGTRMYTVSETLQNTVNERHRFLKPKLSGVLRNEISISQPEQIKSARRPQLPLHIACVGVLEPRKNQRFLLEVFKEIAADQAQLYLYGTGPDEPLLRERVQQEHLADRVHFMGWVPSEDIWPNVDLLLMPSLHEGAPNAVLEALGHHVPVLASDIPEHREILPEICLLLIGDKERWKKKIDFFVDAPNISFKEFVYEQRVAENKLCFNWENELVRAVA